jgi:hypothetical protein
MRGRTGLFPILDDNTAGFGGDNELLPFSDFKFFRDFGGDDDCQTFSANAGNFADVFNCITGHIIVYYVTSYVTGCVTKFY